MMRVLPAVLVLLLARGTAAAAALPQPAYVVPVHAIALADDDGSRASTITPSQVSDWVARANQTYGPANIQFVFDPDVNGPDWETLDSTVLNTLAGDASKTWSGKNGQRATADALGAQHPGKVVVLFRKGPVTCPKGGCCGGCGFSWWDLKFIAMPEFASAVCGHQNITLFAHELGHYLGLAHTHALGFGCRTDASTLFTKVTALACAFGGGKTPAQKAACVDSVRGVFDGDASVGDPAHRVTDTTPDPYVGGSTSCPQDANDPCDATHTALTLASSVGPVSFPLPRDSVMSYYDGQGTLTSRQIEIVRATMAKRFPEAGTRRPDPAIAAGATIGEGYDPFGGYESPDVWVDSVKNGWDAYPPYQSLDTDGYPMGPGDALWLNESNRIWFRVRNLGSIGATDVTVKVHVDEANVFATKCGRSVSTESALVGEQTIAYLGPLEEYASYLPWTPTTSRPVRIRVAITPVANEVTLANNTASETRHVTTVVIAKANAGKEPTVSFETALSNPCGVAIPVIAVPVAVPLVVPPGPEPDPPLPWDVTSNLRRRVVLRPESVKRAKIKLTLPATAQPGDVGEVMLALFQLTPPALATAAIALQAGRAPADEPPGTLELIDTLGVLSHVALRAHVDCAVASRSVEAGTPIVVSGAVAPAHADTPVALRYTGPSGESTVRLATTDRASGYTDSFVPLDPGRWSVRAFWEGDIDHAPAESRRCRFRAVTLPSR